MRSPFFVLTLILFSFARLAAADIQLAPGAAWVTADPHEALLQIDYQLHCRAERADAFQGLVGQVVFQGTTTRVELFAETNRTQLALGRTLSLEKARLILEPSDQCQLAQLTLNDRSAQVGVLAPLAQLALQNSPYLVIRKDQYPNRYTDLPLALGYSWMGEATAATRTLRYTMIFSDEDTKTNRGAVEGQMARYGRATDIEWIYEVAFSTRELEELAAGHRSVEAVHPLAQRYHRPLFGEVGHTIAAFAGKTVGQSQHPVLYNWATHNVFGDEPRGTDQTQRPIGHALAPLAEIVSPSAREELMFRFPWMFAVADREMKREGKFTRPFSDYLYVLLDGRLSGHIRAEAKLRSGETMTSGNGNSDVDRLGEDLYGRQSYTGLPFGYATLQTISDQNRGELHLLNASWSASQFQIQTPKIYRFTLNADQHWELEDITRFFDRR